MIASTRILICAVVALAGQALPSEVPQHVALGIPITMPRCRPILSSDGTLIAFMSVLPLTETDRNDLPDAYVLDRRTSRIALVSRAPTGLAGDGGSYCPSMSADGRLVSFTSDAWDLSPDDRPNTPDVFVHDRATGSTKRLPADSSEPWLFSAPTIAASGSHVVFDAVQGDGTVARVLRFDIGDARAADLGAGAAPTVSADGTTVAFVGPGPPRRIWVHTDARTWALDGHGGAVPDGDSFAPALSEDGQWIAFVSRAGNMLERRIRSGRPQVYLQRVDGTGRIIVSATPSGAAGHGFSGAPAIDRVGNRIVFQSQASDLGCRTRRECETDANLVHDVFLWDRTTGHVERISGGDRTNQWMDPSELPGISSDGRVVAFLSRHPISETDGRSTFDLFIKHVPSVLVRSRK